MELLRRLRSPGWIVVVAATAAAVTVSCNNNKSLLATVSSSSFSFFTTMNHRNQPTTSSPPSTTRSSGTITVTPNNNSNIHAILQASLTTLVTRGSSGGVQISAIPTQQDDDDGLPLVGLPNNDDSSSTARLAVVHVVILVHGWMGNPMEMNALRSSLVEAFVANEEDANTNNKGKKVALLVHCAAANDGNTHDGIAAGGTRLAQEIQDLIGRLNDSSESITLSMVGNSLGGLYARYALADLHVHFVDRNNNNSNSKRLVPAIFATTATPHLGVGHGHTYLPLSSAQTRTSRRWMERGVAAVLQQTGADLFRIPSTTVVIDDMTFNDVYIAPLRLFRRRLAYANVHGTDFQVPTATAAFVDPSCTMAQTHRVLTPNHSDNNNSSNNNNNSMIRCIVETDPQEEKDDVPSDGDDNADTAKTPAQLARALDRLGWTKVFCDVRQHLPAIPLPRLFRHTDNNDDDDNDDASSSLSSAELYQRYARWNADKFYFPAGHTVMVANAKNEVYAKLNKAGKPVMDYLAADMVRTLLSTPSLDNKDDAATSCEERNE
eukprot:scaffold3946_cov177-Amphora_coffeaeformis.AAC.2